MKIRNGFVSNSSSSSFVVISKEDLPDCKDYLLEDLKYVEVRVEGELKYCRRDIMLCSTMEDKIKYLVALCAHYYEADAHYFIEMERCVKKIEDLGKKHGYLFDITYPPLRGFLVNRSLEIKDVDCSGEDDLTAAYLKDPRTTVRTYVDVSTECGYTSSMVDLVKSEDTTELESYIFNPDSFCVLGGDEYSKTSRLAHRMRKIVDRKGYKYRKFGDDGPDHEIGDPLPYESDTGDTTYSYAYHWGEYYPGSVLKEFLQRSGRCVKSFCRQAWWEVKWRAKGIFRAG